MTVKSNKGTKEKQKKYCPHCKKEKILSEFYTSNSTSATDGRHHICRKCLLELIDFSDLSDIQQLLMELNKPFLYELWETSIKKDSNSPQATFGLYLKNLYLNDKDLTWKNSRFEKDKIELTHKNYEVNIDNNIDFKITPDLVVKWGKNYDPEDYYKLEDFYNKMMESNKIESAQDKTYLKKLSVISLKMDKELESGNYSQVKQLGDLFSKYMADSKFRAMDQSDATKTGGLRTFSQIYSEVEKDDFIPPWEEYRKIKGLKQDIVDKTIMYILNYTLKLNKSPHMITPPSDTPSVEEVDAND